MVSLILSHILCAKHDVAGFELLTSDQANRGLSTVTHVEVVCTLKRELQTFEITTSDNIHNTGNSVSTVNSRCAIFQYLNALDHVGRNGLVVTTVNTAFAINKRQRTSHAHATKVDLYRSVTTVICRCADWRTGHRRHALQQSTDVSNARRQKYLAIDYRNRAGTINVSTLNA